MPHTKLYPFQVEGVRAIRDAGGRTILADDTGLGKTIQALYYADKFLPEDPPGPIVVVVPSHLKLGWNRQAYEHLGLRVEVLDGQRAPADKPPPLDANQVYVVNYDILVPPKWHPRTPLPKDSWAEFLCRQRPRLVIFDEGQYIKNPHASRSRASKKLSRAVPQALILTATPMANKPMDLWALVHYLDSSVFPSYHDFGVNYTHARKKWYGWEFKGARNLDQLHDVLVSRGLLIRRRKAEVLDQLPAVTTSVVDIEIDRAEYDRAEENYVRWAEEHNPGAGDRARQAEELTRLTGLKKLAGELKAPAVSAWVKDYLETGGKILLGAIHHSVTGEYMRAFGRRAVIVNGLMDHEQKQHAFDKFNLDPKCRVMVANLEAGGTGWSCKATSDLAFCELPWRPDTVTQFIGRIHGIERGEAGVAAHARFFVAPGTIEDDLCATLERKQAWASEAIDGDPEAQVLDIHTQVKAMIRRRRRGED